MKLFAQCGFGLGDKVLDGLNNKLIDGAIFGCKDITPDNLNMKAKLLLETKSNFEILLDPQFYVTLQADNPTINPGKLEDWSFFKGYRRSQFELSDNIDKALETVLEAENSVEVTSFTSPNIYISKSFDSIEAVIAKNFIRCSKKISNKINREKSVYATLALGKEALLQSNEFEDFLNDITALENPPDGFYLIIGTSVSGAVEELYHSEIICNWMLLNHVLQINGFKVINGYSDIFSPFLGIAGAHAGATGWWGTTQIFSLNRFFKSLGSMMNRPLRKYLSNPILKRINHRQLTACEELFPGKLLNKSRHDKAFLGDPDDLKQSHEILQTWDALQNMNNNLIKEDINESISFCEKAFLEAESILMKFENILNSNSNYIKEIQAGLRLFKKKANL